MNLCIVVIGYNRPKSLERSLNSLSSNFDKKFKADLYISIDKNKEGEDNTENKKCELIADSFEWPFGLKKIKTYSKNLGLRKHILTCGDIVNDYDAILMLEDDIVVSDGFCRYIHSVFNFYRGNSKIAGYSLYNHKKNFNNGEPFSPLNDGYDNYFLQVASSWGQLWTKEQWNDFKDWYHENLDIDLSSVDMPNFIYGWPDSSWLKYFIAYMVIKDLYFVYPRYSVSSNFCDSGTHNKKNNSEYQVEIYLKGKQNHNLSTPQVSLSKYDSFFESVYLKHYLNDYKLDDEKVSIDFYGLRKVYNTKFLLSTRYMPFKVLKSYALRYKPYELNVLHDLSGEDLFLYDTSNVLKNKKKFTMTRQKYLEYSDSIVAQIKKYIKSYLRR